MAEDTSSLNEHANESPVNQSNGSSHGSSEKNSNGGSQRDSATKSAKGSEKELYNGMPKDKYMTFKPQTPERPKTASMEVIVDHGVERAMKVLKRKLIKEGLFKELKARRYYSKPSEEKKRKLKESLKKIRKEESRRQKSQFVF